jgi:hypothetical protein
MASQVASALALEGGKMLLKRIGGKNNRGPRKGPKANRRSKVGSKVKRPVFKRRSLPKRVSITKRRPRIGNGKKSLSTNLRPPVAVGSRIRGESHFQKRSGRRQGVESVEISGREFIGPVTTRGTQFYENLNVPLTPLAIPSTRLAIEATLWTKFSFVEAEIEYVPICGTSTTGAFLFSHIDDPELSIGAQGTLTLANSLTNVPGSVIIPVWATAKHKFMPRRTDKREFYITPDIDDENRFTLQGILKCLQMSAGPETDTQVGLAFLRYKVILFEPILSQNLNPGTWLALKAIMDTAVSSVSVQMKDNGYYGAISVTPGAAGFTLSTTYAVYFNFSFGEIRPLTIYFLRIGSTMLAEQYLYHTANEAVAAGTGDRLNGTYGSKAYTPSNGIMYVSATGTNGPEISAKEILENQADELFQLRQDMDTLKLHREKEESGPAQILPDGRVILNINSPKQQSLARTIGIQK